MLWYPTQAKTGLEWGTQHSLLVKIAPLQALSSRPIADAGQAAAQQQNHQRLLGMQAILCLLEDYGLRSVEYCIRNLSIAMRGQAVHEHGVGRGVGHQCLVHLVRLEDGR